MKKAKTPKAWAIRDGTLPLGRRVLVMGILNVTPDSFSDGGRYLDPEMAVAHGLELVAEGADLLDVGGESTRPGSEAVPAEAELRRVLPVIRGLAKAADAPLSVDTRKAEVARRALEEGARIVNDVSALSDPRMARVVAEAGAGLVIMHMKGDPKSMQEAPSYVDVVAEVKAFLFERGQTAERAGISSDRIALDPGIGFGKRTGSGVEDNLTLLRHLPDLRALGYPLVIGASRKRFIGSVLDTPPEERLEGSLAAASVAAFLGVDIVRVHDVKATRRAVDLAAAVRDA